MYKVNDLFGTQVINQATGDRVAPVHDVVLSADLRQIVALVLSPGGLFSDDLVVRWPTIVSLGDVIVIAGDAPLPTLKNDPEVAELRKQALRITGLPVMSASGDKLGTISDIGFDAQGHILGYETTSGILGGLTGHGFLPSESVQTAGKDALIATVHEIGSVKAFERMHGQAE